MLDVRHSSFKSRVFLAATLMATTLLGGCNQTTGNLFTKGSFAKAAVKKDLAPPVIAKSASNQIIDPIKVAGIKKSTHTDQETKSLYKIGENSSWCGYLKNNAAANAEIIASPTLSASTDEEGNGSFNIGMNLLDFKKAELIRQSGEAKCQAHIAGKSIKITMRLANESTKFASAYAQYKYLNSKTNEVSNLVAKAKRLVNAGELTVQQSNQIEKAQDNIKAEMNLAKFEADKRKDIPAVDSASISGSNQKLVHATRNLQAIDRDIRTIEAFDVSIQAGYRYDDGEATTIASDDYYAKIKLGIRLGALSNRRKQYEDAAEAARLTALDEENSGPLWQTEFAAGSIAKSLVGLRAARQNLTSALYVASDTARRLNTSNRPELTFAALQSKLDAISIAGKIASVQASIKELENNQRKLSALAR